MEYFPIFGELLKSDTYIFLLIGVVIASSIGIRHIRKTAGCIIGMAVCAAIYIVCELMFYLPFIFFAEYFMLFAGTLSLGGIIGFLLSALVSGSRLVA